MVPLKMKWHLVLVIVVLASGFVFLPHVSPRYYRA
jgi:hypothetical protein